MKNKLRRLFRKIFMVRPDVVWHPESPGIRVVVYRSVLGRLFKPKDFATLREALKEKR